MEREEDIAFKLTVDPLYIKKARKSICKGCINNIGWVGEYYSCKVSLKNDLRVKYRDEGVFHTEIYECTEYKKSEESIDVKNIVSDMEIAFEQHLSSITRTDELGSNFIKNWLINSGYESNIPNLAKLIKVYWKYMFKEGNWKRLSI